MRKMLLLLVLNCIVLTAMSQNVGIGTDIPDAKLRINHRSSDTYPTLTLFDSLNTGYAILQFLNAGGTNYFQLRGFIDNNNMVNSYLDFAVDGGPLMTLRGNGNLGINSPSADYRLDVGGDINISGGAFRINGDPGLNGQILTSNGTTAEWVMPAAAPQISFAASLTSLSQTVTAATEPLLTTYTESHDDGGNFNNATGEFLVPSDGLYEFNIHANWNSPATGSNVPLVVRIEVDGNNKSEAAAIFPSITGQRYSLNHTYTAKLIAGNVVRVRVRNNHSGSVSILGGGTGSATATTFSGVRLY